MHRGHPGDDSWTPLGQRRGISDLARSALSLDLHWTNRADSVSAARQRSYPSPPMSGSPSIPPKLSQEAAERTQGTYQTTTHDVYRGIPTTQGQERTQTGVAGPRQYMSETLERTTQYSFPHPERPTQPQPLSYTQLSGQIGVPPGGQYLPSLGSGNVIGTPGPLPNQQVYAPTIHAPIHDTHQQTSPKARKTKGHVASACVPCKKAHLRCVLQNKAEQCVDVQHKKRGRPRLRDDSQTRYEAGRLGSAAADAMRRPLSVYGGGSAMGMVHHDNLRRTQSYRVLKSQPAQQSIAPRYPERGLASDANIYPPPLSISTARIPEEPVAYLRPNLEFAKASPTFLAAIGRPPSWAGSLREVLAAGDRSKADRLADQVQEERRNREYRQLPAISTLDERENVMQRLGFTLEGISRYQLDWQQHFIFEGQDGQQRPFQTRLGLAKEGELWFVVMVLQTPPPRPYQYPTPSPNPRDMTYPYQPTQLTYSQPTPMSATFDPRQSRLGEPSSYGARQTMSAGAPPPLMSGRSPGLPSGYASSSGRPGYGEPLPSYQVPRSELAPPNRPQQPQSFQLPPIQFSASGTSQLRDERSRVEIGGLLDHQDPPRDPPQQ
ncbi:hypothetical protein QBC35DRAFT_371036 [Podospora australis]|uniref:Zn(2)-C6 fungal-type domain-containing protein n=1 Tax=Podospora australis TaxID=1536484 RepID=A0AAN7ANZ7_9PEZI|nr:hypothetical protein QBC35DRAFT_371036 [Podospora australis]